MNLVQTVEFNQEDHFMYDIIDFYKELQVWEMDLTLIIPALYEQKFY